LPDSTETSAPRSPAASRRSGAALWRFLVQHPVGVLQALAAGLLVVVVLQNLEPTSIDLLFWSVPDVPKLVLMAASILAGGVGWEILRRRLLGRRRAARRGEPPAGP
jgi:uncharacterized integral membrane protein